MMAEVEFQIPKSREERGVTEDRSEERIVTSAITSRRKRRKGVRGE